MTTTPQMGLVLPTDHGSAEVWDTILDAVFTAIDSHSHTTGQGVPIASAALRINADVSWSYSGTNYAVKDLKAVDFAPVATSAVSAYAGALFVNSADNELYYRTIGGSNVKFTSGAALNVAAFTGGIGGDYAAVGALESFDDATDSYWLQQQGSPRPWAGLRVGNVDIYQQAASIATRVRLQSPNALAASYALTLPAALPAAAQVLTVSTTGTVSVDGVLGTNSNIKLQGTGHILRGSRTITIPINRFLSYNVSGGGATTPSIGLTGAGCPASSSNSFPIMPANDDQRLMTITSIRVWAAVSGGSVTFSFQDTSSGGNLVTVAGATASTSSLAQYNAITLTPTTPYDMATLAGLQVGGQGGYLGLNVNCAAGVTCNVASVDLITTVPT